MAKRAREQALKEKRERKRLKKEANALAAANPVALDENGFPIVALAENGDPLVALDENGEPIVADESEAPVAEDGAEGARRRRRLARGRRRASTAHSQSRETSQRHL